MKNKKLLYVDMDGVIADFQSAVDKLHPGVFTNPDYEEDYRSRLIDTICEENPRIFRSLDPIPMAIDSVLTLSETYDVYFLSTPMWCVPESFMDKRHWIHEHFGHNAEKRLILSHRKDLAIGNYLIDDRTANGAGDFLGEHIHFGTELFPDWPSVIKHLTISDHPLKKSTYIIEVISPKGAWFECVAAYSETTAKMECTKRYGAIKFGKVDQYETINSTFNP